MGICPNVICIDLPVQVDSFASFNCDVVGTVGFLRDWVFLKELRLQGGMIKFSGCYWIWFCFFFDSAGLGRRLFSGTSTPPQYDRCLYVKRQSNFYPIHCSAHEACIHNQDLLTLPADWSDTYQYCYFIINRIYGIFPLWMISTWCVLNINKKSAFSFW